MKLYEKVKELFSNGPKLYNGTVHEVPVIKVKAGIVVLTPQGLGTIKYIDNNQITCDLFKGYQKTFNSVDLRQYSIVHTTGQIIPITPCDYKFLYGEGQSVQYRISNKCYAILTQDCKNHYEDIFHYNKTKYGYIIIQEIKNNKLTLVKWQK